MISMKDIAKQCDVSIATVSKALNGGNHKDISEATKMRIRKAAEEAGYFPNAAARTLKTNRSNNLGVLFADEANSGLTHDFFSAVLEAFKLEAESRGYDITFINPHCAGGAMTYLERCRHRSMDGVVIACIDFEQPEAIELMNSTIPAVTIDYVSNNCTSVVSDNLKGMIDLTEYIVSQGHKKIAYIHGEAGSAVTKIRLAGFYRILDEHHITVPEEYICPANYLDFKTAAKYTKSLLALKEPPTCIIYPDDTALIGGANVIREAGLTIGEDISIAGYDGLRVAKYVTPKITTVHQNTDAIGKRAAIDLIRQIEQPRTTTLERIVIESELVRGESVKPPKKSR